MTDAVKNCHLVVLSHGLWGTCDHFKYIEQNLKTTLKLKYPNKKFAFFKTKSNEKFKTYDGIDLCGSRVAQEILHEVEKLSNIGFNIDEFSLVGYSLGGLIARFAIGVLYYKGFFQHRRAVNFITFCSPHVGVLTPGNSISVKLFNNLIPWLLGKSGKQMFLKDNVYKKNINDKENIPLLVLMATPSSVFYQGLLKFENKALYSNIRSDIRTSWWTSGISYINPFEILDKNPNVNIDEHGIMHFQNGSTFELKFVNGYEPVILDVNKAIKFTGLIDYEEEKRLSKNMPNNILTKQRPDLEAEEYIQNLFFRKLKWLILLLHSLIYFPMWISWFILHNSFQVFTSTYRVIQESPILTDTNIYDIVGQLNHSDFQNSTQSYLISSSSSSPLVRPTITRMLSEGYTNELTKLENGVHDQGDTFLQSVFDAVTSSKEVNESIFDQKSLYVEKGDKNLVTSINKLCSVCVDDIKDWEIDFKKLAPTIEEAFEYYQILKPFKLGMSTQQRMIIKNLNNFKWQKFPLYISKTNSTHAAAIVRHDDPKFEEGKIVVHHFCNEVFVVQI